jgi:hypothetical protein
LRPAVVVDLLELFAAELNLVAVLHVSDVAPRRLAHFVALLERHALLRVPFLKLHGVAAAGFGHVDQPARDVHAAVMVDADFGNDVVGLTVANQTAVEVDSPVHTPLLT